MEREKIKLLVEIELDPIPGAMHTPESAVMIIDRILFNLLGPYKPRVYRDI